MNQELEQRFLDYLDAFETFAQQATPQAVDFALAIAFWESLGILIVAWIGILGGSCLCFWLIRKARQLEPYDDTSLLYFLGMIASGGTAAVGLIYAANPWFYIGVFRPELKLARDVFNKLVGQ